MMIQTMERGDICCFIVFVLAVGHTSAQFDRYVCMEYDTTDYLIRLQFNTSILSEIDGMCSCKFYFVGTSFFHINTDLFNLQNCNNGDIAFTVIGKQTFPFTCNNNTIERTSAQELFKIEHDSGDTLWLIFSITSESPVISGQLDITSKLTGGSLGPDLTMKCYVPNTNIPTQPTTQEPSTTDSAATSRTSQTSTTSTTDSTTLQTSTTSITSTKQSTSATPTKLATSPSTTKHTLSSQNMSISDDTTTVRPNSEIGDPVPVTAIAGGAAGGVAVLVIIAVVVTIICYRNKKSKSSNEADKDPKSYNQYQMNGVYDNNQTSNPHNDDQFTVHNSVNEGPEDISTENILYESANSLKISKRRPVPKPNLSDGHHETQNIHGQIASAGPSSGSPDPVEKTLPKPEFMLKHEISPSGDVYAVVKKSKSS